MTMTEACSTRDYEPSQSGKKTAYESSTVMNKMSIQDHLKMYWQFFFEDNDRTPDTQLPQQQVKIQDLYDGSEKGLKASWLGHSSLLINIEGYSILTDPVFERKVSLVGPTRFNKELPLDIDDLGSVDVVIISHDHYDHLNKFSVQKLSAKTGVFLVPTGVGEHLIEWGIPEDKIKELGWWEEYRPQNNLMIAATPSQHFSGRGLFDRNKTLWASWVIQTPANSLFFSGDTGYSNVFKEIGAKYGPFDVTFLECGAYNEKWSNVHMFPEQTVQAFIDLTGKVLQPVHWATFNLSLHSWYEPIERLTQEAQHRDVTVSIPVMGSIVNYEKPIAPDFWWSKAVARHRLNHDTTALNIGLNQ